MKNRHLFLIGSGPPMPEKLAESFASLLEKGPVVLLYKPRKDMSIQEYSSVFTDPITSHSPDIPFHFIRIKESYEADEVKKLKSAGGLMIGGGDTVKYQQYIAESELAPIIRTLYTAGIPIAGFSAGALIVPDMCVISAKDNEQERTLYKKGLGLVRIEPWRFTI
ncbi:Type 1 glutamine amidotransferase-like domain-containing protein [Halobacillus sp. Marseille-P3879]|uniref:Type 1 glutamine amidotransferase-like domain-containing protein n=1 Tax=Halobacillus sp. Marseille-P3879 TaxID=2045014 RepID=UPI000C7B060C|nr:Type 1 glutamine amidotransferase-like domain-containing protein [Halobacillus sp. Marseille-P3879]